MAPLTITITDPTERLIVESALAFARELQATATNSRDGQVLDNAEGFCLNQGREFLRSALTAVVQAQAEAVEKKGRRPGSVPAVRGETTRDTTTSKS
jgi:hypothetical protein